MAEKQSTNTTKKVSSTTEKRHEHERQKKEVTAKLLNLSAAARAEIVNDVVSNQIIITKQFGNFTDFLREQSVIGIGIGLVFGTQTKTVVDSIMKSLINPLTTLVLPGQQSLSDKTFHLTFHGRHAQIVWGAVVYNLFSFLMVALVVYAIYRLLRLDKLAKKKDA